MFLYPILFFNVSLGSFFLFILFDPLLGCIRTIRRRHDLVSLFSYSHSCHSDVFRKIHASQWFRKSVRDILFRPNFVHCDIPFAYLVLQPQLIQLYILYFA